MLCLRQATVRHGSVFVLLFPCLLSWDVTAAVGIVSLAAPGASAKVFGYPPLRCLLWLRLESAQAVGRVSVIHVSAVVAMEVCEVFCCCC